MNIRSYCVLIGKAILLSLTIQLSSCEKEENTVTDIDGNTYKTITIGNQTWMAENLRTTTYKDGTPITPVEDRFSWRDLTTEAYCWYDNDQATYGDTYGAIYNYYAVETGMLCPAGWHVASHEEWQTLEEFLSKNGHNDNEGEALKATFGWENDGNGTDEYGFLALPGGCLDGGFNDLGRFSYWWVTGKASGVSSVAIFLVDHRNDISQVGTYKSVGFSVRCITN